MIHVINYIVLFTSDAMSNEEHGQKINEFIKKIKKNKELAQKKRVQKFTAGNYDKQWEGVKSMLLFCFYFLLGDITILLMQLRVPDTYKQTYVKQMIDNTILTYDFVADFSNINVTV
jgi:hypothetical protein